MTGAADPAEPIAGFYAPVHRALTELEAVKRSRTWRAGTMLLSPLDVLRRIVHRR